MLADQNKDSGQTRIRFLISQTKVEHFTDEFAIIYKAVIRYFMFTQMVITNEHFLDLIKRGNVDDPVFNKTVAAFLAMRQTPSMQESEFRYQILRLKDQTKSDMFTEALVDSMDILQHGKKIGTKFVTGFSSAIGILQERMAVIESSDDDELGIVHVNSHIGNVLAEYADRKYGRRGPGLPTGFSEIDDKVGGFQNGDLVFLAGYTSEGKSTLTYTMVDKWVFELKKNIVIGTAEHPQSVIERRLVCIRSADKRYGYDKPINYTRLKQGRLNQAEERQLEAVVQDMNSEKYGKTAIFRIPTKVRVGALFTILKNINHLFKLDAFAWDYINYAKAEFRRNARWEEKSDIVQDAKINAVNFDGRGIVVVSPFQVSRNAWEAATKAGRYTLSCMAETSEAEKAADIVWSILQTEEGKHVGQLLKARDAARRLDPFDMVLDTVAMRFMSKTSITGVVS